MIQNSNIMYGDKQFLKRKFRPKKVILILLAIIGFATVLGTVIMLLWNSILPNILGTRPIKLWEAIGLLVMFRLLVGGFKRGGMGRRMHERKKEWRDKWMHMSDEEKAEFKTRWKERCGRRK